MESKEIDFQNLPVRVRSVLSGPRLGELQIIVRREVLKRVHDHGQSKRNTEVCGVLLGDVYEDRNGPYLHVESLVEGAFAEGSAGQVTFTAATWAHIHNEIDRHHSHLRIVGWYHTHPGHGIFFSGMDLFLHENFFPLPWQMALVHDPHSGDDGIFCLVDGVIKESDFLIESHNPEVSMSLPIAELPRMTPVAAPMPESLAVPTFRKVAKPVVPGKKKTHRIRTTGKIILALFGLVLYTATGLLIALLIQQMHWHLPTWPGNTWPG